MSLYEYKKRIVEGEDFYYCDDKRCDLNFKSIWDFEKHLKVNHERGYKGFECSVCKKRYSHRQSVSSHMWCHKGIACEKCNKQLSSINGLIIHQRIHSGEKPYECKVPFCYKKFRDSSGLRRHLHGGGGADRYAQMNKKYQCSYLNCFKGFASKQALLDHTNIHTGELPYHCHSCDEKFSHRTTLYFHERNCEFKVIWKSLESTEFKQNKENEENEEEDPLLV